MGCNLGYFVALAPEYKCRLDLQMHSMVTAGNRNFFAEFLCLPQALAQDMGTPSNFGIFAKVPSLAPTLLHTRAPGGGAPVARRTGNPTCNATNARDKDRLVIKYKAFHEEEDIAYLVGLI